MGYGVHGGSWGPGLALRGAMDSYRGLCGAILACYGVLWGAVGGMADRAMEGYGWLCDMWGNPQEQCSAIWSDQSCEVL